MLSRISAIRRLPTLTAAPVRFSSSINEGSVAQSKGFSKKEKAHEDQYARQHEAEQLKKLREQIEQKKKELEELQQKHEEIDKETK